MIKNYLFKAGLVLSLPLAVLAQSDFDCSSLNTIIEDTEINICEPGENIILKARSGSGNDIYWYEAKESEQPLFKGEEFDADFIDKSTSYWASDVAYDLKEINGLAKSSYSADFAIGFNFEAGLVFEADQHFIIKSVDIFPTSPQEDFIKSIRLIDAEDNILDQVDDIFVSAVEVIGSPNPITVELNFKVPKPGVYKLLTYHLPDTVNPAIAVDFDENAVNYPYYVDKVAKVTSSWQNNDVQDKMYFYFYNWSIVKEELICESDREEIKVNVNDDYPEVPVIDSEYVLCGDADFSLSDIQVDDTNELQWYDEEGNDLSEDTVIEEGEVYLVADLSAGGCLSEFTEVAFIFQDISDIPLAEASQSFEEGSNADLTSLEVEGENLRWYADEDKAEELPEDTLLEDGMTYYVSQTLEEHCESDLIGITVTETLGVADVYFEGLKYNNPVQDILYLSNDIEIESVTVYDLSGRQLSVATDKLSSNELRMDLSGLSAGVYFFNLHVNEGTKMIKIVKQ